MAGFRGLAIGGLLIVLAFLVGPSLGEQVGILSETNNFVENYPVNASADDCDWRISTSQNINFTSDCSLTIDNLSINAINFNLLRYDVDTDSEWLTETTAFDKFETGTDEYGDYVSSTGNNAQITSNDFYSQNGTLYVDYQYRELTDVSNAELVLWDVSNGSEEDSTLLTAGSIANNFSNTLTFNVQDNGEYELRILVGNQPGERKIYSLRAEQNSDDLPNSASGKLVTEVNDDTDNTIIDDIQILGDKLQNDGLPFQVAEVSVEGYVDGERVATETFRAGENLVIEENIFSDTVINRYRLSMELFSETATSPELTSVTVEGSRTSSVTSPLIVNLFETLIFILLIGFGIVYLGYELSE